MSATFLVPWWPLEQATTDRAVVLSSGKKEHKDVRYRLCVGFDSSRREWRVEGNDLDSMTGHEGSSWMEASFSRFSDGQGENLVLQPFLSVAKMAKVEKANNRGEGGTLPGGLTSSNVLVGNKIRKQQRQTPKISIVEGDPPIRKHRRPIYVSYDKD
jgi:hypothetical protein